MTRPLKRQSKMPKTVMSNRLKTAQLQFQKQFDDIPNYYKFQCECGRHMVMFPYHEEQRKEENPANWDVVMFLHEMPNCKFFNGLTFDDMQSLWKALKKGARIG